MPCLLLVVVVLRSYDGCGSEGEELPAQADAWKARAVGGQLAGKRVVACDSGACARYSGGLRGPGLVVCFPYSLCWGSVCMNGGLGWWW